MNQFKCPLRTSRLMAKLVWHRRTIPLFLSGLIMLTAVVFTHYLSLTQSMPDITAPINSSKFSFISKADAVAGNRRNSIQRITKAKAETNNTLLATSASHSNLFFQSNDVLQFDHHVLANIQATYNGAHAYIKWSSNALMLKKVMDAKDLQKQFSVLPLSATVDRRPLIVRKQLWDDTDNITGTAKGEADGGSLLGCAISSTTFVSNLEYQDLKKYKRYTPTCDVCFQFSNPEDRKNFVPGVGYEESPATKCFGGNATVTARFADWQKKDERFAGYGYPWTVDCALPNGIKELTCREISRMEKEIVERDGLQRIYYKTLSVIDARVGSYYRQQFTVHSSWPWGALMSHDDDRSRIAHTLSKSFDDTNSAFVPKDAEDLKLAHVEGPVYDKAEFEGHPSLKSMNADPSSQGGLHTRLLANLFHLIRNAPGSTHMIAVVDGQARQSYEKILGLLNTKVSILYPTYGHIFNEQPRMFLESLNLIPISKMSEKSSHARQSLYPDMTLMELLRYRQIKIHMVPILTPSLAFEKSVCGGQYQFATYLAARFASDYHVIMFIDGDTAIVEKSATLQTILYDRFFSSKNKTSKCAGHRLRLIEQYVKEEDDTTERVLACTVDLSSAHAKWDYAMKNCHLKEGHIVARTDSIYAFSVHHPDTLPAYLPRGVDDCINPGNKEDDKYFLKESEFVQLHLRDRMRQPQCSCFVNQ